MSRKRKNARSSSSSNRFCVGDRVEFLNYKTAISWGDRRPQQYGFVEQVDGSYIYVRPRWWPSGDLIERYPNEIQHAD